MTRIEEVEARIRARRAEVRARRLERLGLTEPKQCSAPPRVNTATRRLLDHEEAP